MWTLIMKAFFEGFAEFMRTFWKRAANQAFVVMVLIVIAGFLAIWIHNLEKDRQAEHLEYKADMSIMRNEYRSEIIELNLRIDTLRKGLDDCNEARIRVEAQNAALLQIIKKR